MDVDAAPNEERERESGDAKKKVCLTFSFSVHSLSCSHLTMIKILEPEQKSNEKSRVVRDFSFDLSSVFADDRAGGRFFLCIVWYLLDDQTNGN